MAKKKKKKSTYGRRRDYTKNQFSKLVKAENAIKDLPDSKRKKNLLTAINKKKNLLRKLWGINNQYKKASGDEREDFNDDFEDTLDDFRDTSNFPDDSISGKCVACEILKEAKKLEKKEWKVVSVTPTDDRKQYVNFKISLKWKDGSISKIDCDPKPDGTLEHHGRNILITAKIDKKLSKKRVYFQIHPGSKNRKLDYKGTESGNPDTGVKSPDFHGARFHRPNSKKRRKRFRTHYNSSFIASTITDKKGEAKIIVRLGHYGGDKFCVSASAEKPKSSTPPSAESAPSPKTGKFEVWKKLWYSQVKMKKEGGGSYSLPSSTISHFKDELKKCYIKLTDSGETSSLPYKVDWDKLKELYVAATKNGKTKTTYNKRKVVFIAIDNLIYDSSKYRYWKPYTLNFTAQSKSFSFNNHNVFNAGSTKTVAGIHNWIKVTAKDKNNVDVSSMVENTVTGLSPLKVTKVKVRLKSTPVISASRFPIKVTIELFKWRGINGIASRCFCTICVGAMKESYKTKFQKMIKGTTLHEVSHNMGLVKGLPWEDPASGVHNPNPSHCSEEKCVLWFSGYMNGSVKSKAFTNPDGSVSPAVTYSGDRPIVYHNSDDVNCSTFIQGTELTDSFKIPKYS
ncbi:MAG: hypothetical protein COA78_22995 [Blastopirellula sp.]|nr:MAG: hypothetical protein COA78_22995 [Blastopirellula sp.]